ncbi:MAG: hypothetical protein HFE83_04765 [Lachnospiraceae bacterium]|jgi:hypothetical protein|nr:hypothetical protein [Lachnospiraceae bacterium]
MKKYCMILLICILLTSCGSKNKKESLFEEAGTNQEEIKQTDESFISIQETEQESAANQNREQFLTFLEKFEPEQKFVDMDPEKATSYGEPLQEFYEFKGRMTKDGVGYVIGFLTKEESPLSDLSIYETEDHIEAERWNEAEQKFDPVFSFPLTYNLIQTNDYKLIYLQPNDMEEPEELYTAFQYSDTKIYPYEGEEGIPYLEDILERGVRFSPPESGAYIAVTRIENGRHWWEYIPLSSAEEEKILLSSETLIPPEWYGKYGLEFHVSQQIYEKTDQEMRAVIQPVLALAKERCRFEAYDLSEIHDICNATLCYEKERNVEGERILITEEITDPEQIKRLEQLIVSSTVSSEGKCPYSGVLRLTRKDGKVLTLNLVMDSCDGFILGSMGIYSPGKEGMAEIWQMFPKIREYSGWRLADTGIDKKQK